VKTETWENWAADQVIISGNARKEGRRKDKERRGRDGDREKGEEADREIEKGVNDRRIREKKRGR
jgi:hypothetical protein